MESQAIEKILRNYIDASPEAVQELDAGHINRSFLIHANDKYVLQCLNKKLYSQHLYELENNYRQYRKAWRRWSGELYEWQCPKWIKSKDKKFFYIDENGDIWRLYNYIQGDIYSGGELQDTGAAGEGLGLMHRILQECPKDGIKGIKGVFGHLHDLDHYYREYRMQDSSRHPRDRELDACISSRYEYFSDITVPGRNIIHGDAKLGNMIFRNGKTVGFIDLDTIMEGSRFDDIADCMRSCRVESNAEKIGAFLEGYEEGANVSFTDDAVKMVVRNYNKNHFMLGMRYYTDYLAGNVYFRESYPGESLEKARMNMLS